tara:strand:+ start:7273 stop:7731 length:459 start_codon:yes stop_codon:yes gene_type:complete
MLKKTHLAIGLAVALFFMPYVNHEVIFIPVILITSILPDADSGMSSMGRKKIFKPVQMVFKHRGFLHTYTACIAMSILLAFFYPVFALPFFLGYSFHLFADSFTVRGIKPFWPLKYVSKGMVSTGGKVDRMIFMAFMGVNIILIILLIVGVF